MARGSLQWIANLLSLSRLGLAAAFVASEEPRTRLGLIVAAAMTDVLDGWLARLTRSASRFGALLDPVADRMFVFLAVCVFLVERAITTGQYFVFIFRDLMTAIGFIVAKSVPWLRPVTFRARPAGKAVTVLQLVTLVALIVQPGYVDVLLIALGIASAVAVVDYTFLLWRERSRQPV
jgi:phosphatidylglycerophosphate synthase